MSEVRALAIDGEDVLHAVTVEILGPRQRFVKDGRTHCSIDLHRVFKHMRLHDREPDCPMCLLAGGLPPRHGHGVSLRIESEEMVPA